MDRAKRSLAPNAKQKALAQLADLKKNGTKRSDQFEVRGGPGYAHSHGEQCAMCCSSD